MMPTMNQASDARGGVESLYQNYQRPILAYLTRLVSDRETAEDLCQDTFIKAFRSWSQHNPNANPASWLYRIATNTAYDHLRRRRRIRFTSLPDLEPYLDSAPSVESHLDESEPVQAALAQLPTQYRVALVLHSCEGRSTQEIAAALGCSNSAVKTRLFRARERFRQVYQG